MSIFGLLIFIIIAGVIFYLLYWLIGQIPLPEPFNVVARVVLGLAAVILLIGVLTGSVSVPVFNLK